MSSNTSICTDSVTFDVCTFIGTGCWGDETTEWSFQRGAINLCDTNILRIIQPIKEYINVNKNNYSIMHHIGFLKKPKFKLGSHTLQFVASWGLFLEGPEKFSHPESHSKISKLMITELFYSRTNNINRGSLHKRNFRRIHVFRYR